jgi:hypothetical protein
MADGVSIPVEVVAPPVVQAPEPVVQGPEVAAEGTPGNTQNMPEIIDPESQAQIEYFKSLNLKSMNPDGVHTILMALSSNDVPLIAGSKMQESAENIKTAPTKAERRKSRDESELFESLMPKLERQAEKSQSKVEKMIESEVPETKALGLELKWTMNRSGLVDTQRAIEQTELNLSNSLKTENPGITAEQIQHEIENNAELNSAKARFNKMIKLDQDVSKERAELKDSSNKEIPRKVEPLAMQMQIIANSMLDKGGLTPEQIESVRNNPAGAIRECLSITVGNEKNAKRVVSRLVQSNLVAEKNQEELIRVLSTEDERVKKLVLALTGLSGLIAWIVLGKSMSGSSGGPQGGH